MAAPLLSENFSCMNGVYDDHIWKHNSLLLMSLLEETTQGDHDTQFHYNDEELQNMIQSLETEINPSTITNSMEEQDRDFPMESRLILIDGVESMDRQDYCSEYWINDFDRVIPWDIDDDPMEQASSSSPTYELNLCMDSFYGNDDQFS